MSQNPHNQQHPNNQHNPQSYDQDEVQLGGRLPVGNSPMGGTPPSTVPNRQAGAPAGAPMRPSGSGAPVGAPQSNNQQPRQNAPAPAPAPAARPPQPQQQYNPNPRISDQEKIAIPKTENPVQMDALLEGLQLSMTVGEGDTIDGGVITIAEGKSMVVKGTVRSKIICYGVLIITKEGVVEGSIEAGQCWIEGTVLSNGNEESQIDAGVLHLGVGSRVVANIVYDQLSISSPNRGVSGRMISRDSLTQRHS